MSKEKELLLSEMSMQTLSDSLVAVRHNDFINGILNVNFFLSKSCSLAGLRVGFALDHQDLIEGLNRIKKLINSYTLDRLAFAGVIEAIKDDAYFQAARNKVIQTRKK